MISILIPIYNFDCTKLIYELQDQAAKAKIEYEIICYDDKSKPKFKKIHRILDSKMNVSYIEMSENLGRSKIRNWLGKNARYENLLFLDCDSRIEHKKFLKNYLNLLDNHSVIAGGRIYPKSKPRTPKKYLHDLYGKTRESKTASERLKNPIIFFHSNNFCIKRTLFIDTQFEEKIDGYGYEDTLFALDIKNSGKHIHHIDNPVTHIGLEHADRFLEKTRIATQNLALLFEQNKIKSTRLIDFYMRLKNNKLDRLFYKFIKKREDKLISNLLSEKPKLRNLDLYKFIIFKESLN